MTNILSINKFVEILIWLKILSDIRSTKSWNIISYISSHITHSLNLELNIELIILIEKQASAKLEPE
jgi:hypothetical protein